MVYPNPCDFSELQSKCGKCKWYGVEESICNRTTDECLCRDGYFGDTCEGNFLQLQIHICTYYKKLKNNSKKIGR